MVLSRVFERTLKYVLWAYNTKPCATTNETPFILTYYTEVVIPAEVRKSDGGGHIHKEKIIHKK